MKKGKEEPKTWKEFRDLVDETLKKLGLTEDVKLNRLDLWFPSDIDIFYNDTDGLTIEE
jgi:hypothetical protein